MGTRLVIAAGEASGDLHGADLARALSALDPDIELSGMGGVRMAAAGVHLIVDAATMGMIGLVEILGRVPALWRAYRRMRSFLNQERPDLLVLIDYPDFNFWLARAARHIGVPVVYYISPQIWAWRRGRIRTLRRLIRRILVIFPFEEAIYRAAGVPVTFVGHPMLDRLQNIPGRAEARIRLGLDQQTRVVGLLPGSRRSEIRSHLPTLLGAAARVRVKTPVTFLWGVADDVRPEEVEELLQGSPIPVMPVRGHTYAVMRAADLLVTASGTATLEAGLLGTPMVIVYRLAWVTWWIGKLLVDVPAIGMVNLVTGRQVAPELLQGDFTADRVAQEVLRLLEHPEGLAQARNSLEGLAARLGGTGATGRAAEAILACAREDAMHGEVEP